MVVLGWYAAAVVGYLIWAFTLPTSNPDGQCEGLGWGCTLAPRDGAWFAAMIFGPPVLAGGFVASLLVLAVIRRALPAFLAGTIAAVLGMATATLVLVRLASG